MLLIAGVLAGCTVAGAETTTPTRSDGPFPEARAALTQAPQKTGGTAARPSAAGSTAPCPVTVPGDPGFVAPRPYPATPPPYYESHWYGSPALWTMLSEPGESWHHLPRNGTSRGQKTFWWSSAWDNAREPEPAIVVIGRRLDGPAPEVRAGAPGTNATADFGTAMLVGVELPMPGCWELRARYRSAELAIVVSVVDD